MGALEKNNIIPFNFRFSFLKGICVLMIFLVGKWDALYAQKQDPKTYIEYRGQVFDNENKDPIPKVHLSVESTHISSITNKNGGFLLKVPKNMHKAVVRFTKVGYQEMNIQLVYFDKNFTKIFLLSPGEKLQQVDIYSGEDPRLLVQNVLEKKERKKDKLTGFYREKINQGRHQVMLGEAVVQIDEDKWASGNRGRVQLYKSRKSADYKRLDTVAIKFRGGPYSGLYLDLVHYPEYLFYKDDLTDFDFSFEKPTRINNRYIYVVHFEEKQKSQPWYHGEFYIDAKTNALVKAIYSLNVDNRKQARRRLVVQKPKYAIVTPLKTRYQVDYLQKNSHWYFSYSHFYIELKVNWKKKLFNKHYSIHSELVITDRSKTSPFPKKSLSQIKPTFIMADDVSGFKDPNFWGANNIIEPDKSLKNAIEAIREKLENQ